MKKSKYIFIGIVIIIQFQERTFSQNTENLTFVQNQSIDALNNSDVDAADLNNDGYFDALVSMYDEKGNLVLINDKTGKLIDSGQKLGTYKGGAVSLSDLNGDGYLDAFICNIHSPDFKNGQPNTVWFNDGTGKFTDSGQRLGNSASCDVKIIDLDKDKDMDAIVANLHNYDNYIGQPNEIWINDGKGYFTLKQLIGNQITGSVDAADLNNDGFIDLFFTSQYGDGSTDEIWYGCDSVYFHESKKVVFGKSRLGSCRIVDLNNDSKPDLMLTGKNSGKPFNVFINDGAGIFTETENDLADDYSGGIDIDDLDNDGDLDIFMAKGTYSEDRMSKIYLNNGNGIFSDAAITVGTNKSSGVKLADFDKDGDLDAYIVNRMVPDVVWFNTLINHHTSLNINNEPINIYPNPFCFF